MGDRHSFCKMEHYYSLNSYYRKAFGGKVYKLALDGGFTCPNRDGTIDTRGCIFCSAGGSGEFAEPVSESIRAQIEAAKERVSKKAKDVVGYIAYFQSYTNTYGDIDRLRKLFTEAADCADVVGLSIATRPDCLGDAVIGLLADLNQRMPIFVELGLQTIHEETAELIRRGYGLSVYDDAVKRLKEAGLNVVVHIIFGLPNETPDMMLETVKHVGKSGADGIKLQLLHVLDGTDIANMYKEGALHVFEEDAYLNLVCDAIEHLPPHMVIHRVTGDGPKRLLLAPLWSANKREVLNRLRALMDDRHIQQGSKYE